MVSRWSSLVFSGRKMWEKRATTGEGPPLGEVGFS